MSYRANQPKTPEASKRAKASASRQPSSPAFDSTPPLLQLHAVIGNRAVGRMLQAKLKVNQPGDKYEQEADRVAESVMRMPEPGVAREGERVRGRVGEGATTKVQRKCAACAGGKSQCPKCAEEDEVVQRKTSTSAAATFHPEKDGELRAIQSQLGEGQPLDGHVSSRMASALGYDFSNVRIHTDSKAAQISQDLRAKAFTVGKHVAFGTAEYQPGTLVGDALIAHELAHVAQQSGAKTSVATKEVDDTTNSDGLEQDADFSAFRAMASMGRGAGKNHKLLAGSASPAMRSGLRLQRCNGEESEKEEKGAKEKVGEAGEGKQEKAGSESTRPKPQAQPQPPQQQPSKAGESFPITEVSEVRSLEIGDLTTRVIPSNWKLLQNKLGQRDKLVNERLRLVKANTDEHNVLTKLQGRWDAIRKLLSDRSFDPATGILPASTDLAQAQTDERADSKALPAKSNKFVKRAIEQFLKALANYLDQRRILDEERVEFQRFDPAFIANDVQTLLGAIPHATFTSADLKALVGVETGDLTIKDIAGLKEKSKGKIQRRKNPSFVGISQVGAAALPDAIKWAKGKGVTIPDKPDPRTIPAEAIKLAAAYLGWNMDVVWRDLPETKPTGVELKKFIFAAYNGGQNRVRDAAKAVIGTKARNYGWDDVKDHEKITSQMRNYVEGIVKRLTPAPT